MGPKYIDILVEIREKSIESMPSHAYVSFHGEEFRFFTMLKPIYSRFLVIDNYPEDLSEPHITTFEPFANSSVAGSPGSGLGFFVSLQKPFLPWVQHGSSTMGPPGTE